MSVLSTINEITINLTNIEGKEIELSKMFVEIEFNESVFGHFLNGKLLLIDTTDLITNFPIIGNENLNITISTSQYDSLLTFDFKIYKFSKDEMISSRDKKIKVLTLYFCSSELLKDQLISVSRKFSQQKSETIIQWLLTNVLESEKTLTSTTSSELLDVYSNFWKSSDIIKYLCKVTKSSEYSDYVFFENIDGFTFKPLSNLLSESSTKELVYDVSAGSFIKTNNIRSFKFNSYFDILSLMKVGFFGSTLYKFDDSEYLLTKTEKTLTESENEFMSLGKNSFFDSSLSESSNLMSVNYLDHDISIVRNTLLQLLHQYNLVCKLYGDFNRKAGDIVNFSFPNTDNETQINDHFDGNWFVVAIKHNINQSTSYEQNVLLTKNAAFNNSKLSTITSMTNI